MTEQVITFEAMEQAANLFGSFDENIKLLERKSWKRSVNI